VIGLWWAEPDAWPRYLVVTAILVLEWPFCIRLTQGVEVYMPVMWTSAAAAYVLGPVILPVFWVAAPLGFALIVLLDSAGLVPAVGLAAESAKRYRGEPYDPDSVTDGDIRHSLALSEHGVRVMLIAACRAGALPLPAVILISETLTVFWRHLAPVPGRMAPSRTWARMAQALGPDMPLATQLLQGVMVGYLVVAWERSGLTGFAAASLSTLPLHAILKRLNDTRLESERRREELLAARDQLERRQRLATIGQTAATVFHQVSRHHGAIGMYAHLLGRGTEASAAREHATRILASVDEANRVIEELLRFGQDRALNLYPHAVREVVEECAADCAPRAATRGVTIAVADTPDVVLSLDKHKVKQAIGNLLDNAIAASQPGMRVEVETAVANGVVRVVVRDYGSGIEPAIRDRLFTPFATTKPDGIGLGLVLARELVQAHGGTLEWRAAAPGTAFVVELPRTG